MYRLRCHKSSFVLSVCYYDAILLSGYYRWLHFDYLAHLLSEIVDEFADDCSLDWKSFRMDSLSSKLPEDIPINVVEKFFQMFGRRLRDCELLQ